MKTKQKWYSVIVWHTSESWTEHKNKKEAETQSQKDKEKYGKHAVKFLIAKV
jgi:hypothetical protein